MRKATAAFGLSAIGALMFASQLAFAQAAPAYVELRAADFDKVVDGRQVKLYTIKNKNGMVVNITNYGARVEQILVPDRDGKLGDVAQGYETIDQVMAGQGSMGAFIGRYANRIGNGTFMLDGAAYKLAINDLSTPPAAPRQNTLHGGKKGSRFRVFDAMQLSDSAVQMNILFADGEEGFPGDLPVKVVYSVTDKNELVLSYEAKGINKKTVANFTGHTFFNLSGDLGTSIEDHILTVNSSKVLEVSPALVPNGVLRDVANTPMDFRKPKSLAQDIKADYDLLKAGNGYDNHFVLSMKQPKKVVFNARIMDPKSGRTSLAFRSIPATSSKARSRVIWARAPRFIRSVAVSVLSLRASRIRRIILRSRRPKSSRVRRSKARSSTSSRPTRQRSKKHSLGFEGSVIAPLFYGLPSMQGINWIRQGHTANGMVLLTSNFCPDIPRS